MKNGNAREILVWNRNGSQWYNRSTLGTGVRNIVLFIAMKIQNTVYSALGEKY